MLLSEPPKYEKTKSPVLNVTGPCNRFLARPVVRIERHGRKRSVSTTPRPCTVTIEYITLTNIQYITTLYRSVARVAEFQKSRGACSAVRIITFTTEYTSNTIYTAYIYIYIHRYIRYVYTYCTYVRYECLLYIVFIYLVGLPVACSRRPVCPDD